MKRRRREGAVAKMLRGPYSHSHGAQRAAIKLHYQTGRLWGGGVLHADTGMKVHVLSGNRRQNLTATTKLEEP